MKIELPWGPDILQVEVPDTWDIVFPKRIKETTRPIKDEVSIVKDALNKPCPEGSEKLQDQKLAGKKILIIVDDNTRPTPVYKFFHLVLKALSDAGATLDNILVLPALGVHTKLTSEEMGKKIGTENLHKIKWENPDPFDQTTCYLFGTTSRGTPVYLNHHLKNADFIITLGMVEPHLWAGFGGGMKNILPGIASAETIGCNHELLTKPAKKFNRVGIMPEENPFRLDIEEARDMIAAPIFGLNVIIDHHFNIVSAYAGNPIALHRAAIKDNIGTQGLRLERPVDGVLCNSYPMEINFKQSMKCVGNSLPALKRRGAIMGFLKADKGLDDISLPDPVGIPRDLVKFILRLLGPSFVWPIIKHAKKGVGIEERTHYYYVLQLLREHDLFLYTPTLSEEEAKALFYFKNCPTPEAVITEGIKKLGKHATIAIFPEGGSTFPIISS